MDRLFGTDGVRGVANRDLTPDLAYALGFASAHVLAEHTMHRPVIVVGTDTRISCDMLGAALMSGVTSAGADVLFAGVITTPGVAWLTRIHNADAGVMISASHNTFEYNGIKLFSGDGFKLPDETEDEIEAFVFEVDQNKVTRAIGKDVGRIRHLDSVYEEYTEHLLDGIELDLTGIKMVVDCANGSSSHFAPKLLETLGADVIAIHHSPDGCNINRNCGSTHLESLIEQVLDTGADIGVAFDGDADRLLLVDEKGQICNGDVILAILALHLRDRNELRGNTIVATVMSNLGLERLAEREGINFIRTAVGDRYVLQCMLEENYALGGEQSGHVILLDHTTTGDGILSLLYFLQAVDHDIREVGLSEMCKIMDVIPQLIRNVHVENGHKKTVMEHPDLIYVIEETERELGMDGRVLVRASGTEPLVRVMLEGIDQSRIDGYADKMVSVIERILEDLIDSSPDDQF
ncbi:MAG: phosphoglucosamine mutase [Clostridiaceae bacterium]|jgi:phosphoglucosamine mutase|nr:phosphoglucosamine mutase [Clostridiaceae bacterium]